MIGGWFGGGGSLQKKKHNTLCIPFPISLISDLFVNLWVMGCFGMLKMCFAVGVSIQTPSQQVNTREVFPLVSFILHVCPWLVTELFKQSVLLIMTSVALHGFGSVGDMTPSDSIEVSGELKHRSNTIK